MHESGSYVTQRARTERTRQYFGAFHAYYMPIMCDKSPKNMHIRH